MSGIETLEDVALRLTLADPANKKSEQEIREVFEFFRTEGIVPYEDVLAAIIKNFMQRSAEPYLPQATPLDSSASTHFGKFTDAMNNKPLDRV